jgi:hypothetical protein
MCLNHLCYACAFTGITEMTNIRIILVGKTECKRPFWKPWCGGEDDMEVNHNDIRCEGVD